MTLLEELDGLGARDWDEHPDGTVRFAVVGIGGFAREFALPALADGDYCEFTVAVSGSEAKAERTVDEFDGDRALTYEEYHDGAATDAYDAVYVATPNALHLDMTETAATHGKHVLCEKPLEATADRAERLVAACEEAGVTLMTAYRMQLEPAVRRMRELVGGGAIGEVVHAEGNFHIHSMTDGRGPDHWRYDPELAGSGAIGDIGVYPLNTGRFVLGADPTSVGAVMATPDPAFEGVDEHVSMHVGFPDATATFLASFDAQLESRLTVYGTDGSVALESAFPTGVGRELTLARGDASASVGAPNVDEVREEFDYFAHCVLTETRPEPDGADGLTDVRVIEAAQESDACGERIDL